MISVGIYCSGITDDREDIALNSRRTDVTADRRQRLELHGFVEPVAVGVGIQRVGLELRDLPVDLCGNSLELLAVGEAVLVGVARLLHLDRPRRQRVGDGVPHVPAGVGVSAKLLGAVGDHVAVGVLLARVRVDVDRAVGLVSRVAVGLAAAVDRRHGPALGFGVVGQPVAVGVRIPRIVLAGEFAAFSPISKECPTSITARNTELGFG
ncbi:hypothetical protein I7X12_12600 [Halosimplex litoreum]|uniref:Uncharacterized protein n=1 Tax=Halosimplex litoreum TaxID=1198301 RepID=A0A7T3KU23_9EURY|nr:hypothetical protein [Halosimplex litoreum]QPV61599.1 hypothetical protein I7X12_12600 [Halosimplex litoreum]